MDDPLEHLKASLSMLRGSVSRWIAYHGRGRLLVMSVGVVAVVAAGWWLVRPAARPIETMLPFVTSTSLQGAPAVVATATSSGTVRVHVAGAVRAPGVYALPADARVVDAVAAAGGATRSADLDRINLAQSIVDAEQVFVPRRGMVRTATTVAVRHRPRRSPTTTAGVAPPTGSTPAMTPETPPTTAPVRKVNLNTATADQLDALPGVGPSTARAIVSYRARRGPFAKVEDLLNIDGIGPKKLESLRSHVEL